MHELAPSHDHPVRAEIFRAARMCAPCMDRLGTLTFEASPLNSPARDLWCGAVLEKHLLPAILSAHAATAGGKFREILEVDAFLDSRLVGPASRHSTFAGRMIAADFRPPGAEKALARYFRALETGESSGHLATVLAARAAVFHIPPRMALSALVFLEMRAAPVAEFWASVEACLRKIPQDGPLLKAA